MAIVPVTLLALSGSLRQASFNTQLAHEARRLAPNGVTVEVATLHGIPLYDGDTEAEQGVPEAVLQLKQRIVSCDGLLLVTPEYNNGIPGVMKNGIDWLSRADMKAVFFERPTAVIGATPGGWGTLCAQSAWLPVLRALATRDYHGSRLQLSHAQQAFRSDGKLQDEKMASLLVSFLQGFADFTRQQIANNR
ncbi:NADPH-dependent FMN reductase [Parahaliea mediterranea]|uniref:NADPH-dependent FMN reductase n=1 Tax=Parahaliea mediterranea TaxID=651086 RepID=UPI000E2E926F|nr:NADPH-dependent FMN reductase [Parahaliea mediterranea]